MLFIRGNKYTVDTLNELDGELCMKNFNECSIDKTIVIGGMYSDFNPLSNYYKSPFKYGRRKYITIEQGYQHQKALMFDDLDTAAQIMDTDNPAAAKRFSFKVKGFKQDVWDGKRYDIMLQLERRNLYRTRT